MFNERLATIDYNKVEQFCRTWKEAIRVEYKANLVKIPKVVSSLANTQGGIWVIGAKTNKLTNLPELPMYGFSAQPGIEEQIAESCYTGINPPIIPFVRVIDFRSDPSRVVPMAMKEIGVSDTSGFTGGGCCTRRLNLPKTFSG